MTSIRGVLTVLCGARVCCTRFTSVDEGASRGDRSHSRGRLMRHAACTWWMSRPPPRACACVHLVHGTWAPSPGHVHAPRGPRLCPNILNLFSIKPYTWSQNIIIYTSQQSITITMVHGARAPSRVHAPRGARLCPIFWIFFFFIKPPTWSQNIIIYTSQPSIAITMVFQPNFVFILYFFNILIYKKKIYTKNFKKIVF